MGSSDKTTVLEILAPQDRLMQTFRMPRPLVAFLKEEAERARRDLTGHVIRWLEGIRTHFGLPEAAATLLEADRRRMGMERYEYLLHVLYQRSLSLREQGPGFDAPDRETPFTKKQPVASPEVG